MSGKLKQQKAFKPSSDDIVIEELRSKLEETTGLWKRAVADYQNLERRSKEEQQALAKIMSAHLLSKILPIVDNLEQAVESAPEEERKSSWFAGITMVLGQCRELLKQEGLVEIEALGRTFDPHLHEAVDTGPGEENEIIAVVTKGYTIHGRVLRPARVKVGKSTQASV